MSESSPPPQRLTLTHWLILVMASIGLAFDIYVLQVQPLIARPALPQLLGVDPDTASGTAEILAWSAGSPGEVRRAAVSSAFLAAT